MYITKKSGMILKNLLDFFVIYIANVHALLYFFRYVGTYVVVIIEVVKFQSCLENQIVPLKDFSLLARCKNEVFILGPGLAGQISIQSENCD